MDNHLFLIFVPLHLAKATRTYFFMVTPEETNKLKLFAIASGIFAAALFFSGWILENNGERKFNLHQIALSAGNKLRAIETTAGQAAEKSLSLESNT